MLTKIYLTKPYSNHANIWLDTVPEGHQAQYCDLEFNEDKWRIFLHETCKPGIMHKKSHFIDHGMGIPSWYKFAYFSDISHLTRINGTENSFIVMTQTSAPIDAVTYTKEVCSAITNESIQIIMSNLSDIVAVKDE